MELAEPTMLHRKSGMWGTRDSWPGHRISPLAVTGGASRLWVYANEREACACRAVVAGTEQLRVGGVE
jgi:hypothetical protein